MTELEQLRLNVEAEAVAFTNHIEVLKETLTLKAKLAKLKSPIYAKLKIQEENSTVLDTLLNSIEMLATGTDKTIKPIWGYGHQVDQVLTILNSLQFAKLEHKEIIREMLGADDEILSDTLVEETLSALGKTPYYQAELDEITESVLPDLPTLRQNLETVVSVLGLSGINMYKLTDKQMQMYYANKQMRAAREAKNTRTYLDNNPTPDYEV